MTTERPGRGQSSAIWRIDHRLPTTAVHDASTAKFVCHEDGGTALEAFHHRAGRQVVQRARDAEHGDISGRLLADPACLLPRRNYRPRIFSIAHAADAKPIVAVTATLEP